MIVGKSIGLYTPPSPAHFFNFVGVANIQAKFFEYKKLRFSFIVSVY